MLLARLHASTPPFCRVCKADRRVVAFVRESDSVRNILDHVGQSADPLEVTSARGPPAREPEVGLLPLYEAVAQPEPDFQFDHGLAW